MRKITLTSILALSIACPAFADITTNNNDPKCDNTTIGTYQGSTELEAQWTANKINLKWYSENQEIAMASNAPAATCTYADDITLPTEPERSGYTFAGWVVRPAALTTFDLSTLASQISTGGTMFGYTKLNGNTGMKEADYGLTTPGEWAIEFNYGTVKGVAKCSITSGTYAQTGTPTSDVSIYKTQEYCWCQASGFDAEKDGTYLNVLSPSWVFVNDYYSSDNCADFCTSKCVDRLYRDSDFRSAVYGITQ